MCNIKICLLILSFHSFNSFYFFFLSSLSLEITEHDYFYVHFRCELTWIWRLENKNFFHQAELSLHSHVRTIELASSMDLFFSERMSVDSSSYWLNAKKKIFFSSFSCKTEWTLKYLCHKDFFFSKYFVIDIFMFHFSLTLTIYR